MGNYTGRFRLPEAGVLMPNNQDDPLPYYYKPVIGRIFRARIEQGLSLLSPPYGAILEVGYGSGVLLPSLCRLGDYVAGIDLASDPEVVGRAVRGLGAECTLVKGDLCDELFPQVKFDLVVAMSVLEHIDDLDKVFRRFYEILKPGGCVLVGMPRVDRLMQAAFSMIGFRGIERHHVSDYRQCMEAAKEGFELTSRAWLPSWLPESLGLYFNLLFRKL